MTDKPIIFSAPMVRALLEGRKTQTRRVINPQPQLNEAGLWRYPPDTACEGDPKRWVKRFGGFCQTDEDGVRWFLLNPTKGRRLLPYAPGDRLYVREHWRTARAYDDLAPSAMAGEEPVKYEADGMEEMWGWPGLFLPGRFRQGRHMPRWASRITLTVTEVRVQRLQEISEADAVSEGCPLDPFYHDTTADGSNPHMVKIDTAKWISPRGWYHRLWDSLHGPDAWDANPWVVAVSFTVDRRNIDAIPRQD